MRGLIVAMCSTIMIASYGLAVAEQKERKVTREEAWSICAKEVASVPPDQHSQRYVRGAACMKRFGYTI